MKTKEKKSRKSATKTTAKTATKKTATKKTAKKIVAKKTKTLSKDAKICKAARKVGAEARAEAKNLGKTDEAAKFIAKGVRSAMRQTLRHLDKCGSITAAKADTQKNRKAYAGSGKTSKKKA